MDKLGRLSDKVYQLVTAEVKRQCKKSGVFGSHAIDRISAHQQSIRVKLELALARELETFFSLTMNGNFDKDSERYRFIEMGHKFLLRFIKVLNKRSKEAFVSLNRDPSGRGGLRVLDPDSPLIHVEMDSIMTKIIQRMASGLPPVTSIRPSDDDEDDFREWRIAVTMLEDVGYEVTVKDASKIPFDILFKKGKSTVSSMKPFPDSVKLSINRMAEAWKMFPIYFGEDLFFDSPMKSKSGISSEPMPTSSPKVITSATASIDLASDIAGIQQVSSEIAEMFKMNDANFERTRGCAQTVLDFLEILKVFLEAVTADKQQRAKVIILSANPTILIMLNFYLSRKCKKVVDFLKIFDEMASFFVEKFSLQQSDPIGLANIIRRQQGSILIRHSKFLRRDLVVGVLGNVVRRTIPGIPREPFCFFDENLDVKLLQQIKKKTGEVAGIFNNWLSTFGEDFTTLPEDCSLDHSLWREVYPLLFGNLPARSIPDSPGDEEMAMKIDTDLSIRAGASDSLDPKSFFMTENAYPFALSEKIELIPDLQDLIDHLPSCFTKTQEMGECQPVPVAWEILIRYFHTLEDDLYKPFFDWISVGERTRLSTEDVLELLPGNTFGFPSKWFTSAKKVAFHLFLRYGTMEENLFQKIYGLNDLYSIMNENFIVWQALPDLVRDRLRVVAPMFKSLTPLLGTATHVQNVAKFWKHSFDHHGDQLKDLKATWDLSIQVVKLSAQKKLFSSFPALEQVRLLKNTKQLPGIKKLMVAMMYVKAAAVQADILWRSIWRNEVSGTVQDGLTLLRAYSWSMISFLYQTSITTGLRSQNLSKTKAKNSSSLWTPALVLKNMDPNTFDILCGDIFDKSHRVTRARKISVPLIGFFESEMTGFRSIQLLAVRLYLLRYLLFRDGLKIRPEEFSLNDTFLFQWDESQFRKGDWKLEVPVKVTDRSWVSFGDYIFKNFIPQDAGLSSVTINTLRKLMVSLEMGAGSSATKRKTGHFSDSSLMHYYISIPWLDQMMEAHPPLDRPFLAKTILYRQISHFMDCGQELDHNLLLKEFSCENRREIVENRKHSAEQGILKQRQTFELIFWTHLKNSPFKEFDLSLGDFSRVFQESVALHSETLPKSPSDDDLDSERSTGHFSDLDGGAEVQGGRPDPKLEVERAQMPSKAEGEGENGGTHCDWLSRITL